MISFLLSAQATTTTVCTDMTGTNQEACICRVPAEISEAAVTDKTCTATEHCLVTWHYNDDLLPVWRAECLATAGIVSAAGGTGPSAPAKQCPTDDKINGETTIGGTDITAKFASVCQKDEYCYKDTAFTGTKNACFLRAKVCSDINGQTKLKGDCLCAKGAARGPLSKKDVTANIPQKGQECKKDQYCSTGIDTITDQLKGFTLSETSETQSRHDKAAADALLLNAELGRKQWASCDAALAKMCPDRTGSTKISERCKCGPGAKVCGRDSYCTVYWLPAKAGTGGGYFTSEENFVNYGTETGFCSTTPYQNSLLASGRGPVVGVVLAVVLGALAL